MTPPKTSRDIAPHLRLARDMAANHHLIEEDEIYCEKDGRQLFDAAIRACREICPRTTEAVLSGLSSFRTTNHRHSQGTVPQIIWPWP